MRGTASVLTWYWFCPSPAANQADALAYAAARLAGAPSAPSSADANLQPEDGLELAVPGKGSLLP